MLLSRLSIDMFPPQAVLLAADVVLVSMPKGERTDSGFPFESHPPYGTVDAQTSLGPVQIAVFRLPEESGEGGGDRVEDYFSKTFGMSTFFVGADITDIAIALDDPARVRLLNFLLGFCKKAFDLGTDSDFARSCLALVRLIAPETGVVHPIASVTDHWTVLKGLSTPTNASFWSINPNRLKRLTAYHLDGKHDLQLSESVNPGDIVLAIGEKLRTWVVGTSHNNFCDLLRSEQDTNPLRAACLKILIPNCPTISAILQERSLFSPAKPIRHDDFKRPVAGALEAAISDGEGKVFLRGWLYDPLSLVASIELCGLAGTTAIEPSELHRFLRPDLEKQLAAAAFMNPGAKLGFVAHIDDPSAGLSLQPTMLLRLTSGSRVLLRPALQIPTAAEARSAVLTSVVSGSVTDEMLKTCLGPAAAAFHRASLSNRSAPELVYIGRQIADPHTSVLIPLYRNLSFLRFQFGAFACDESFRDVELIYILDSPEQRQEVEHLLRGLNAMHDLPIVLIIMSRNLGYAAANNAGASVARAPTLMLLNSDIVPEQAGWLTKLHRALEAPGVGAVGPKLLFDDESIQHAGLFFKRDPLGVWFNAHFYKGMPRHWPAANKTSEVPGLTGAAILVSRTDFEAVGGICEDFIIGDYEDSDFCLRIRALGKSMVYVPKAELFHFERRSIFMHNGYSGTLACRYNQLLHHSRWSTVIEQFLVASLQPDPAPVVPA